MINPAWTGVLHEGDEIAVAGPRTAARRGLKRVWGMTCGVGFLAARGSIYVVVLPFTLLASLTGVALYAAQALVGGNRG